MAAAVSPARLLLTIGAVTELAAWFVAVEGLPTGTDWEIATDSISHVVERTPTGEYGVWLLATCVVRNQSERNYYKYELRNEENAVMLTCINGSVLAANSSELKYASLDVRPDLGCVVRPTDAPPGTEYVYFKALSLDTAKLRRTTFYCAGGWTQLIRDSEGLFDTYLFEDIASPRLALNYSFTPVLYPPKLTIGGGGLEFLCSVYSEPELDYLQIEVTPGDPAEYEYPEAQANCSRTQGDLVNACVTTRSLASFAYQGQVPVGFVEGATVTCSGRIGAIVVSATLTVASVGWEVATGSISHAVDKTPTGEYGVWLQATCVARNPTRRSYERYMLQDETGTTLLECSNGMAMALPGSDLKYPALEASTGTECASQLLYAQRTYESVPFKALMVDVERFRRTTFYCVAIWTEPLEGGGVQRLVRTPPQLGRTCSFAPVLYPPELTVGSRSLSFVCSVRSEPALDDLQIEASPGDPYSYQYAVLANCVRRRPAASLDECVTTRTLVSDGSRGTSPVGITDGATVKCRGRLGAIVVTSTLNVTNPKTWQFPIAEVSVTQSPNDEGESFFVNITCYVAYVANVGAAVTIRHATGIQQSFTMTDEESYFAFAFNTTDSRQLSWCSLSDFRGELIYNESSRQDSENVTAVVYLKSPEGIANGSVVSVTCLVTHDQPYVIYFQRMGVAGDCSWQQPTAFEAMRVNAANQTRMTYGTIRIAADVNDLQAVRCKAVKTRKFQHDIVRLSLGVTIPYSDLSGRTRVCGIFDPVISAGSAGLSLSSPGHPTAGDAVALVPVNGLISTVPYIRVTDDMTLTGSSVSAAPIEDSTAKADLENWSRSTTGYSMVSMPFAITRISSQATIFNGGGQGAATVEEDITPVGEQSAIAQTVDAPPTQTTETTDKMTDTEAAALSMTDVMSIAPSAVLETKDASNASLSLSSSLGVVNASLSPATSPVRVNASVAFGGADILSGLPATQLRSEYSSRLVPTTAITGPTTAKKRLPADLTTIKITTKFNPFVFHEFGDSGCAGWSRRGGWTAHVVAFTVAACFYAEPLDGI